MLALPRLAFSEVCCRVNQSLFIFQIKFGKMTIKTTNINKNNFKKFDINKFLKPLSNRHKQERETKKYIAAYFAKKASPTIIPHNTKFIIEGFFLILSNPTIDSVQNNNKKTSVDIKKEETLTAGIIKKLKEQIIESLLSKPSLRQRWKTTRLVIK